ncbi:hypothetical protein BSKO_01312 [Bryopsis sp. KO-2023]|nr:hypothetical protein BSKO_01312 [Bryopsis sp. KO-2023]
MHGIDNLIGESHVCLDWHLQCRRWKSQLEDTLQKKETLECTFQLQRVELESKNGMLENLENGMQEQTKINTALSKETEQKRKELDAQISELRGEVGRLSAENDVLRGEVKAHLQVKVSAQSKVEKLRKKLGFTTDESKHIVQELDTMRDKNVELAKLNDQLKSENGLLKDQCNQHSRHCLMLIKENQRLMDHTDRLREKIRTLEEGAKTAPIIKVESSKVNPCSMHPFGDIESGCMSAECSKASPKNQQQRELQGFVDSAILW